MPQAQKMTRDEHIERHKQLHAAFDELMADFLFLNRGKLPSKTTLAELAEWSYSQTIEPELAPGEEHADPR
ncbi:MAG: hypothetical protein JO345_21810 [Streptosporangiaceae bacterium]|nr:hypothetical protein [Streptosporangiaceae bacterium]